MSCCNKKSNLITDFGEKRAEKSQREEMTTESEKERKQTKKRHIFLVDRIVLEGRLALAHREGEEKDEIED